MRRLCAMSLRAFLAVSGLVVTSVPAHAGQRFIRASDGRPGTIDLNQYYAIADPREAAALLMSEAAFAGIDVDHVVDARELPTILLGCGPTVITEDAKEFPARAKRARADGGPNTEYTCVVKFRRPATVREQAEILAAGIRIFCCIPHYSLIVRLSVDSLPVVEGIAAVEWIADLDPKQKYPPGLVFIPDVPIMVYTLVGDTPEARQDIERLGGRVHGLGMDGVRECRWAYFEVSIDVTKVPDLANLWWVHMINQLPPLGDPEAETVAPSDLSGLLLGQKRPRERYAVPSDGHPGWIDWDQYFRMKDPRRAAKLLVEEATLAGLDLDARGRDLSDRSLGGAPNPEAVKESSQGPGLIAVDTAPTGEDTTWCVVKLRWWWSVNEAASVLARGIRAQAHSTSAGFRAAVPNNQFQFLLSRPFVQWIVRYAGAMKVAPYYQFPEWQVDADVLSLTPLRAGYREQLLNTGARVVQEYEGDYGVGFHVMVNANQVKQIVEFVWVDRIEPRTAAPDAE